MTNITINEQKVTPLHRMKGDSLQDSALLSEMAKDAYNFLLSFPWCLEIVEQYFGIGVGGVFAVFLFNLKPITKDIDEWLWVIVGDLPPAYLVTDDAPNPASALSGYMERMTEWVEAVLDGKPIDDLIPVNAEPTSSNAQSLQKRLKFLEAKILSNYSEDLD